MASMELWSSPGYQWSSECGNAGETRNSPAQRDGDGTRMKLQGSFNASVPVVFVPLFQIQPATPPTGIQAMGAFPTTLPLL